MSEVKAALVEAASAARYPRVDPPRTVEASVEIRKSSQFPLKQLQKAEALSEEEIRDVVDHLNDFVKRRDISLNFAVDQATGRTIIRVIDQRTEKVVRQFPPEEVLEAAANMEEMVGALLSASA